MRFLNGLNSEGDIKVQKPMPRVSAVNPTGEVAGIDLLIASGSGWKIDNDNGTISFKSKAGAADFVEKIRIPSDEEEIYIGATKVSKEGHEHTGVYDNYQGWNLKINSETTGEAITTNEDVTLVGSGSVTVSRVGSTITISSSGSEDTWRPVQDNLTSTATDQSLSANQGKVLKTLVDGKAATHSHPYVQYYRGSELSPNNAGGVAQVIRHKSSGEGWMSGGHNGQAVLSINTHEGAYYSQLGFCTNTGKLWTRRKDSTDTYNPWHMIYTTEHKPTIEELRLTDTATGTQYKLVVTNGRLGISTV